MQGSPLNQIEEVLDAKERENATLKRRILELEKQQREGIECNRAHIKLMSQPLGTTCKNGTILESIVKVSCVKDNVVNFIFSIAIFEKGGKRWMGAPSIKVNEPFKSVIWNIVQQSVQKGSK